MASEPLLDYKVVLNLSTLETSSSSEDGGIAKKPIEKLKGGTTDATARAAEEVREEAAVSANRNGPEQVVNICLCASEKVLALGTSDGKVHVLDIEGHEVGWV